MFQTVTESVAIGNITSSPELSEIAQQGYQTVIDLCTPAENNLLNAEEVKTCGLELVSFPIDRQKVNTEVLQEFMQTVDTASKPVYLRCASGLRAGVMMLLSLAKQENWTEEQYLEKRQGLGLQHRPNCPLETFAHELFEIDK